MWLEMKVKQLALDPLSNMPMIILRDEDDKRSLPIWVGLPEANAIALALRVDAPIYVEEEVLAKAESVEVKVAKEPESPGKADDPARIKEWLESIKPGDFDKIERGKDPDQPDE